MVLISLCRNVADINRKMGGTPVSPSAPVSPVPQDPAAAQPAAPEQPFRRPEPPKMQTVKPDIPVESPFQRPAANNAPEAAQQADTKFCRNCGKRIAADAADCPFCGFHLMP